MQRSGPGLWILLLAVSHQSCGIVESLQSSAKNQGNTASDDAGGLPRRLGFLSEDELRPPQPTEYADAKDIAWRLGIMNLYNSRPNREGARSSPSCLDKAFDSLKKKGTVEGDTFEAIGQVDFKDCKDGEGDTSDFIKDRVVQVHSLRIHFLLRCPGGSVARAKEWALNDVMASNEDAKPCAGSTKAEAFLQLKYTHESSALRRTPESMRAPEATAPSSGRAVNSASASSNEATAPRVEAQASPSGAVAQAGASSQPPSMTLDDAARPWKRSHSRFEVIASRSTSNGAPCVFLKEGSARSVESCRHVQRVRIEDLAEPRAAARADVDNYESVELRNVRGNGSDPWFESGTARVHIGGWVGDVRFAGGNNAPSFRMSSPTGVVEGTVKPMGPMGPSVGEVAPEPARSTSREASAPAVRIQGPSASAAPALPGTTSPKEAPSTGSDMPKSPSEAAPTSVSPVVNVTPVPGATPVPSVQ